MVCKSDIETLISPDTPSKKAYMSQMQQFAHAELSELAAHLKSGDVTSVELTQLYLDRIARLDPALHAYVSVYRESALLQAQAADLQRQAGLPLPPLHGLPIAIKDLCEIDGLVTTAGSQTWRDRRSSITSTVVEKLLAAGMIVLGKTHMVEFAFGAWGVNPLMGTPRNPWDMTGEHRIPGGSSSGSAVAVAAALAPAAIGSDTGGSVRAPAAFNGLTGLKTTHGLISLYGTIPLSASLDTIGPITHSALDAALLLQALAGPDPRDPNTHNRPAYQHDLSQPATVANWRIAVLKPEQYPWPVEPEIQAATDEAIKVFAALGATVELVDLPFDFNQMMVNIGALIAAEAHHFHAATVHDAAQPFGPWVRKRILGGQAIDATRYLTILAEREQTIIRFKLWMQSWDLLLTPSLPFVACPLDQVDEEKTPVGAFSRAINYLDTCAITLPAGLSTQGLPIGVQLVAQPWQEDRLLQAGRAFQQATDWHRRHPAGLD
jgi:aspartyl-tRNA(Asn)/glutamyl-tRNA(Gln) amidotransferase subunit A